MYSLRTSFWTVPRSCSRRDALLLADQLVEQQQDGRRRVDRHRRRDLVERDPIEADAHVLDRVDRDAGAADLAVAERIVGVAAELRGQVEGHREAGRAVLDQVAVALVRVLGAREPGVLAHRPEAVAVHAVVDAAGERERSGLAEPLLEPGPDVLGLVERVDLDPGVGEPPLVVGADDRRDEAVLGGSRGRRSRARKDSWGGCRGAEAAPPRAASTQIFRNVTATWLMSSIATVTSTSSKRSSQRSRKVGEADGGLARARCRKSALGREAAIVRTSRPLGVQRLVQSRQAGRGRLLRRVSEGGEE